MSGFLFSETMSGDYTRDGSTRPISFRLTARATGLLRFAQDRTAAIEGHVDAEGLAVHAPLAGSMVIDPLLGRFIRYDFVFTGDDGKSYRFTGQKDVSLTDLVGTMTHLPARILDDKGATWADSVVRFETRDLPSFLASFRAIWR